MIKKIWDAIGADDVGGEIQMDASVITEGAGEDYIEVHCWDGRRYGLTLERMADGCKYDTETGKPIVESGKPKIKTSREALVAMIEAMTRALNEESEEKLNEILGEEDIEAVLETIECFNSV